MTAINRTVAPTIEPVELPDVLAQLRLKSTQEGALVDTYIKTATERAEGYLGQAFCAQTWELAADAWPQSSLQNRFGALTLPRPPLLGVTSVVYTASDGTSTTMPSTDYQVDTKSKPGRIAPKVNGYWPTLQAGALNPVVVTYTAGCASSTVAVADARAAVPFQARQAIAMYAGYLFQVRDVDAPMPQAVTQMLDLCSYGHHRYVQTDDFG